MKIPNNENSWLQSIHHDGSEKYVSRLYPRLGEKVTIHLRARAAAPIRRVFLRVFPDGEQFFVPMSPSKIENPVQWFTGEIIINQPVTHYRFIIEADNGVFWYSAAGVSSNEPLDITDFKILADYTAPEWARRSVFYQIFPDRFANGDPDNDPRPEEYEYRGFRPTTLPWGTHPPEDQAFPLLFYGGDLQGIRQRLDYLTHLGVNALYINPIFTSFSNHKYDVADYDHVDVHFGGDNELIALRNALEARQMRYILDIVPNHCGFWHPWFQKAISDPNSVEAGFFTFKKHPDEYATWLGVWALPKLNYTSQELQTRIFAGPDSVFRRWLRPPFNASGWRIDVANMLARQGATQKGHKIARGIRSAVKETRPDAYLFGENFFDSTSQLQGDEWDGVMNYAGFTTPLWNWLRGYQNSSFGMDGKITSPVPWPTTALEASWRTHRASIPWIIALQQYTILDSHDTSRIRSVVSGNDVLHRLAAIVQMTYPGIAGVYYGDEIGMVDLPKVQSRGCMVWDEDRWDHKLFEFYRKLIDLRKKSHVLQDGGFQTLAIEEDTLIYQRDSWDDVVIVVAHRGKNPRPAAPVNIADGGVPDGVEFTEFFSGLSVVTQNGTLPLPEQSQGASIWLRTGK